ncbi:prohibitin family protein [Streptomyces sp. SID6673]|nr:prohibitin family protein [Streptomyces sp. SID11726]NDZ94895.1 prohibitin family protein [Streptomyces sp. SID11726]NEB23055.1 prohibitin family protein [Streptomyces sp. SID6673]
MNESSRNKSKIVVGLGVAVVLLIIGLISLFSSLTSVGTGQVGVVTNYGKVTGRELTEGLSWISPWGVESATVYDVKTQKDEVQSTAATKDLQDVNGTLVLNYQLERGEVSRMHQQVGEAYKDKLVLPALNEVFKAASAKYTASELITDRAEVKKDVYDQLKSRLEKYGIAVQDVSITNFQFSAEFNKAIESVQIANQQVSRAKQQLEKAKVDAERKITAATGDAEAQRLQQETITPELLRKMEIEAQEKAIAKWNGQLPTTTAGNNGGLLFNIPASK